MKSKDRIIIQKIILYIDDIEKYIDGLEAKDFLDDKKTITACAFTVSQIGEIVKEISKLEKKELSVLVNERYDKFRRM